MDGNLPLLFSLSGGEKLIQSKKDFILREVADEFILVPTGDAARELQGIISLNSVGAEIWKQIEGGKEPDEIIRNLTEQYEADSEQIEEDVNQFIGEMNQAGLIEWI